MDRIRDLTETDGRDDEVLTSTSGGFFGTQYLAGDPPAASLGECERPQYVLRNKSAGLQAASGEGLSPGGDYQAIAVVTDCRLFVLVGTGRGDEMRSVRHDDIVEASAESSSLLSSALVVETAGGERLRFPCRGDVSAVADYVADAAQSWANASRLTDEAGDQLTAGREYLDDGEFERAREVVGDVAAKVDTARERVARVGDGAARALERRASRLFERLRRLEREIAAAKGGHHHASAQDAWKEDHDFERAAREYERAVGEYERALDADGATPPDETLQLRLKGTVRERAVLRVAPMADAKAAREVAAATDDPDEAATEWETALTCYREAVTLDWGERDREFDVDRERARERAAEATDEALDARVEAGNAWLAAGDRIAANGRKREAQQAYERARSHFEQAREIASELRPGRRDGIEERLTALDRRADDEVTPSADAGTSTLSVESVADQFGDRNGERGESPPAADGRPGGDASGQTASDAAGGSSAVRRGVPITERETVIETDWGTGPEHVPGDSVADDATGDGTEGDSESVTGEDEPVADLTAVLRECDEGELRDLVADVWTAKGWSTTVFSASSAYDVVAIRERESGERRLLLWTDHRPDGGAVDATAVRQCATARDSSQGADDAALVTTGRPTSGARDRAADLDVTVVGCEGLAAEIDAAGLTDRVLGAADRPSDPQS